MGTGVKCWRCGEKWSGAIKDFKVIVLHPHELPDLDLRMRVPYNICEACSYSLKIKMEFECQVLRIRERVKHEP